MIIEYGCTKLRAIEEKDTELLLYLINAPEIENMTGGWNLPISYRTQEAWMEQFRNSNETIRLMIELANYKTIGMITLQNIDWKNRTALLEYKINAKLQDRIKGDIRDAIYGILNYAFNELGLNCITSLILETNRFSLKLCKKMGFVEEGILRERVYKNGAYRNQITLSLLKEEFKEEIT